MTRQEARDAGLTRYFTGKPCKHGHIAERRMSDGCVMCADLYARKWQAEHPEKVLEKARRFAAKNPGVLPARSKAWREANPEKSKAGNTSWRERNVERYKEMKAAWRKAKAGDVNETQMRRYAEKRKRTPKWADIEKIRKVYALAARFRALGCDFQVDHVIPLLGKTVCGLHVHNNLAIIERKRNQSKLNRFEGA
jgi:hypothetical protein